MNKREEILLNSSMEELKQILDREKETLKSKLVGIENQEEKRILYLDMVKLLDDDNKIASKLFQESIAYFIKASKVDNDEFRVYQAQLRRANKIIFSIQDKIDFFN